APQELAPGPRRRDRTARRPSPSGWCDIRLTARSAHEAGNASPPSSSPGDAHGAGKQVARLVDRGDAATKRPRELGRVGHELRVRRRKHPRAQVDAVLEADPDPASTE